MTLYRPTDPEHKQHEQTAQVRRIEAWEATAPPAEHITPRPPAPIVIRTGWTQPPPAPPPAAPGFGAGLLTGVIVAGVLALLALLIARMDGSGLAFFAGAMLAILGMFAALLFALWIGDKTR